MNVLMTLLFNGNVANDDDDHTAAIILFIIMFTINHFTKFSNCLSNPMRLKRTDGKDC